MGKVKRNKVFWCTLISFILYLLVWFAGTCSQMFIWKIEMMIESGNYYGSKDDDEGYTYSAHYSNFLLWNDGNLAIASPLDVMEEDVDEYGRDLYIVPSSLIVWMKPFYQGVDEVGVILIEEKVSYQIYLEDNRTARYKDDQEIVDRNRTEIDRLFHKAEEQWDIEMPWRE